MRIILTTTAPGGAYNSQTQMPLMPGDERVVFATGASPGNSVFGNDANGYDGAYQLADGTQHYLSMSGDTIALGVNFAGVDCLVAGSYSRATGPG